MYSKDSGALGTNYVFTRLQRWFFKYYFTLKDTKAKKKPQHSAKEEHLERHKAPRQITKGRLDIDLDFVAEERSQPLTQPTLVPEPMR